MNGQMVARVNIYKKIWTLLISINYFTALINQNYRICVQYELLKIPVHKFS